MGVGRAPFRESREARVRGGMMTRRRQVPISERVSSWVGVFFHLSTPGHARYGEGGCDPKLKGDSELRRGLAQAEGERGVDVDAL